ncbi:PaaI family thioesterase [Pontitalea aquivivens]|uniref:PaaI family thioesterase n=1 Tax=Pontitalea aquivivens TaxID=3388663 RepID=UPI003970F156
MKFTLEEAAEGDNPPDGFTLLRGQSQADWMAGPYYVARRDGEWVLGFRIKERHLNPNRVCHGGMIATFADMLTTALQDDPAVPQIVATISLSVDYLAPAPLGAWVEGVPEALHETGRLLFFKSVIRADGDPVARCSGHFRVTRPKAGETSS